ncbi:hypothetical protein EGW08_002396, partial [Elysia chlorotica]
MQKYIDVDVYGMCGNLTCPSQENSACEDLVNSTHRFYLGFENSFCKDYVTEKFFRWFIRRLHVVPVVRGGADYSRFFPKGSYIDSADFPNVKALSLYLKQLSEDPEAYAKILKEKDKLMAKPQMNAWCKLCALAHNGGLRKVIPDIRQWSHYDGVCWEPTDLDTST